MPAALDLVSERPPQCGAFGSELVDGVLDQVGSFRVASADREVPRLDLGMEDDPRFDAGLLDVADAVRFLGIHRATIQRWARGYAHGAPLLHVVPAARARAGVTFIAMVEAHVLEALRQAGVRPARIRPALTRLAQEFGRE